MSILRAYSPEAEAKYIGIYGGSARTYYLNEVFDQQLFMHLQDEYSNKAEMLAHLKLTGMLGAFRTGFRLSATKADMQRYYALAEKMRYDRLFGLSKAEAVARWASGKKPTSISRARSAEMMAKKGTPIRFRVGSSKGKVKTIMRGAVKTQKSLDEFIKALFSLGETEGGKPQFKVHRMIEQRK
jgi:hypothetical protein|tara:strand:- start:2254 stop:2805 length:552 start_codon:yes stop_codon:yes gene_type:complete